MKNEKKTEIKTIETEEATVEVVKKKFEINPKVKKVLKVTAIGAASAVAGFLLGKGLKGKNDTSVDPEDFDTVSYEFGGDTEEEE